MIKCNNVNLNVTLIRPLTLKFTMCVVTPRATAADQRLSGDSDIILCDFLRFSQQRTSKLGLRHRIFVSVFTLQSSGTRQVPFLTPHLVTVTDTPSHCN